MIPYNFHTHTVFCDGKNTPEEMVSAAISKGMKAIGFSGHSHTAFDESYSMSPKSSEEYRKAVMSVKEKYKNKIDVFCGIEQDYYGDIPACGYNFVIGSVHYILKDGIYIPVDESAEILNCAVREHYNGDIYSLIENYYDTVADVVRKTNCDIIGHFDLITKFNEGEALFKESDERYQLAVKKALDTLLPLNVPFEINVGAISRGYRSVPYPSEWILREICKGGGSVIISGDSHEASTIDFGLDGAAKLAKKCGFETVKIITKDGFRDVRL